MFGLEGAFTYHRCGACGSLFISDAPADLSPFYPAKYYSYTSDARSSLVAFCANLNARMRARTYLKLLRQSGTVIRSSTSFVDVGSGSGDLLRALQAIGLSHVLGIDPYLRPGTNTRGITVIRRAIEDVAEDAAPPRADVVMFHHSLEHVLDPSASLAAAAKLLAPAGAILVRIPIVSYAWERFGINWFSLDAPRHLCIPTERGFKSLAAQLNLRIVGSRYDSTSMQFLASEAYERGLTLSEAFPSNSLTTALRVVLSPKNVAARYLNRQRRGDQAAFVMVRENER